MQGYNGAINTIQAVEVMKSKLTLWDASAMLLAVPVALPVLAILLSFFGESGDTFGHLATTVLPDYLFNTGLLMLLVGAIALMIGVPTAWLTARYRFPGSRVFPLLLVLPLAAPAYVLGYVYADLLDYTGPVQSSLRALLGLSSLPPIRSLPGAALVIAFAVYPYIFLLTRVSFSQQAANHILVAKTLGADSGRVFWKVVLPVARPAIVGGLALVLMETVADYGVVEHYGVQTFTTGIFRTWFAMGSPSGALQLAACLFVIAALLVTLEEMSRKGQLANPVAAVPAELEALSGWRSLLASLICLIPVVIGFIVPVTALLLDAVAEGDALDVTRLVSLISNTLLVALIAAGICVAAAVWLAYASRRTEQPFIRSGIRLATLGYAIPGMVLAVGLLQPLATFDRSLALFILESFETNIGLLMTGSLGGLVLVYVARFLTVAFNNVQSNLIQVNARYDEVAATLGASPSRILRRIHLPLLLPGLGTALLVVFVDVIKELPATLVLRPFNFDTLATRVFRLASDERLAEASTAALLIVLLGLIPTLFLTKR